MTNNIITRKKYLLRVLLLLTLPFGASAQKARDILEAGEVVKKDERVYINYIRDSNKFKYSIHEAYPYFHRATDTLLLLAHRTGFHIYLFPLNPLKYSDSTAQILSVDPINEDAAKAIANIIKMIDNLNVSGTSATAKNSLTSKGVNKDKRKGKLSKADSVLGDIHETSLSCIDTTRELAERITNLLKRSQKEDINNVFTALRNLSFEDSVNTRIALVSAHTSMLQIKSHFDNVKLKLDSFETRINHYNCQPDRAFIDKFVLVQIYQQFNEIKANQLKRYQNLLKAYYLVDSAHEKAKKNPENNFWFTRKQDIEFTDGTISTYTLTVYESGYNLSNDSEIIITPVKKKKSITIIARRFQRFVPEVSAGVAYTDLRFPKFGTMTDSAGVLRVADAGEDIIRKVNFTAMINFNYYIPNSPLHPFYQIGVGVNAGFPTLFTGVGTRINFPPFRRMAISIGYASTWIKMLNTLKIGSPISGTAELEKDISYEFSWPLKPYLSIQYNF